MPTPDVYVHALSAVMIDQHLELELKLASSSDEARTDPNQTSSRRTITELAIAVSSRARGMSSWPAAAAVHADTCVLMMSCLSDRPVDGAADLTPIDWLI